MAAYCNDFVVSVIYNGHPVREVNENGNRIARIPFGSEYKLRIKNNRMARAKVQIFIDDTSIISGGRELLLAPHESIDLERFVDQREYGARFKFISREEGIATGQMDDPTSALNGQIRCVFHYEDSYVGNCVVGDISSKSVLRGIYFNTSGILNDTYHTTTTTSIAPTPVCAMPDSVKSPSKSDLGGTVEGTQSNQTFTETTEDFYSPHRTEIIIWLRGLLSDSKYTVKLSGGRISQVYYDGKKVHCQNPVIDQSGLHFIINGLPVRAPDFEVIK